MPQQDRSKMEKTKPDNDQIKLAGGDMSARVKRDARRRILTGGLVGAPVILTLASRPALANHCSISGMMSGNISKVHEIECMGRTPGYWKTHPQKVEASPCGGIELGPCNPITSNTGEGQCSDYSIPTLDELNEFLATLTSNSDRRKKEEVEDYIVMLETYPGLDSPPFGTPFSDIFGTGFTQNPLTTVMQALWLDDAPPLPPAGAVEAPSPVLAHSMAAYLNACEFGKEAYGMSPAEVIAFFQNNVLIDPFLVKDTFETLNMHTTS